jgi:hypothetical protein
MDLQTPVTWVATKKLVEIAPKNRKKPFMVMLMKNKTMKYVKNRPAVKFRPIIK